jgi:hypothetical protein
LYKFLDGQTYVFGYLPEQKRGNILTGMKRNCGSPTIGMPILLVLTALTNLFKPETVIGWHRAGFRLFWRIRSRPKSVDRPTIDAEVRSVIRRMVKESRKDGSKAAEPSSSIM